jgi:hypothetical protein
MPFRLPIGRDHGVGSATVNEPGPLSRAGVRLTLGDSSGP